MDASGTGETAGTRQAQLRARLRAKRVGAGFTLARFARAAGGDAADWARLEAGIDDAALSEEILSAVGAMTADFPGDEADYAAAAEEERLRVERGFEAVLRGDLYERAGQEDAIAGAAAESGQVASVGALVQAAFGEDAHLLLTQFVHCDAAGRAELVARSLTLAAANPIKAARTMA